MIQYDASGQINVGGCADVVFDIFVTLLFPIGTQVYSLDKALKGVIEPHVIKTYNVLLNPTRVMYTDTWNALWGEGDLCDGFTAVALATAYLENKIRQNQINALNCR